MKKIRVLLLLDEAWNDNLYGNNNMTNWFGGFENIEIATIYCSPEMPHNNCCTKYYQITDKMMLDSIIHKKKAGQVLSTDKINVYSKSDTKENKSALERLKGIRTETMRLCRDLLWLWGKYDTDKLEKFINSFKPHIIFSQRRGSVKICRLERLLKSLTDLPIIAFTGDNEREEGVHSVFLSAWIRKVMVRHALNKTIPLYSLYYTSSEEQADFYNRQYTVAVSMLFKCGVTDLKRIHKQINSPINIVYAGKLYCGRWKTLAFVAKSLKEINKDKVKIVLNIYTKDKVSKKQQKLLNDRKNTFIRGAVAPEKLSQIYDKADIALHVESFDFKNRAVTRYSYSTKVIDCLSCGCAVMAIGWEKHSACIELERNDSAIVVTDLSKLSSTLSHIANEPEILLEYAQKAKDELIENHSKQKVQKQLYEDFIKIINDT